MMLDGTRRDAGGLPAAVGRCASNKKPVLAPKLAQLKKRSGNGYCNALHCA
jgi:hypothetical protein